MTSSLVGSEMCIRDRFGKSAFLQFQTAYLHPSGRTRLRVTTVSHRSVSYTHLTLPTICSV
eukprot:2891125-Prorocentrum_lima.AAC.1